jgi:hypothetical protein
MDSHREGLSSAGKAGVVVVLIIVVLGAAYVGPSMLAGSGTRSTSQSAGPGSGSAPGPTPPDPAAALLPLFGYYSQMQVLQSALGAPQGGISPGVTQLTFSYLVLGKGTWNSTQYTRVQFSQSGQAHNVIAWFSPSGRIDRVDVLPGTNYTRTGAGNPGNLPVMQVYVNAFSVITSLATNSTLISMLSKTTENMTSIGQSQLDVTTYQLAVPTQPYKSLTAKYGLVPGTNITLLVYFDAKMTDGSETTIQVLSLTK